jgi:DNA-binding transcriptional regulator YdaS (Cro superfamily)
MRRTPATSSKRSFFCNADVAALSIASEERAVSKFSVRNAAIDWSNPSGASKTFDATRVTQEADAPRLRAS